VPQTSFPCGPRQCIIGEQLPTTTRKMDFRVTARDNRGGFGMDTIRLNVVNTGAGFAVTAPNTATTVTGGTPFTVTWNVAGTDANGINTSNVNILLTTDATPDASGQVAFPIVLAANTPNDGSEQVMIPEALTSKARVKVEAVGNVFFDISDADFTIGSNAPQLAAIASRRLHGGAGGIAFDIPLPTSGPSGIEPRQGGPNDAYTLLFSFVNPLTGGTASVTGGTGSVSSSAIGTDQRQFVVDVTGVTDRQTLTVTLSNISDNTGRVGNLSVSMRVLVGDVNGDGVVNAGDSLQTRNRSGQSAGAQTFRSDVNTDGTVNVGDATIVRANAGNTVAP
jgi:hypothetical protein